MCSSLVRVLLSTISCFAFFFGQFQYLFFVTTDRNSNILVEEVIRSYILDSAHLRPDFISWQDWICSTT